LRFAIDGKTHFDRARLGGISAREGNATATLTGYAYETIPNNPIITGKAKGPGDRSIETPNR
jgi:hypothetical protein